MKRSVLPVIALLLTRVAAGEPFWIAREGQAVVPIVVPAAARPTDAVRDLVTYLEQMTGGQFRLVDLSADRGGLAIRWGPQYFRPSEAHASRPPWLQRQVAQVYTDEHGLYLTGGGPEGCDYAVYVFLEDVCGMRFFHPGPLGTHVPVLPDLCLESLSLRQVPSFVHRSICPDPQVSDSRMFRDWQRWALRSRQGGPQLPLEPNLQRLVPSELYPTHPDYFPFIAGSRVDPRSGTPWQPELSNPDVVQLAVERAREHFAQHPQAWGFSLCNNGAGGWSESAEAVADDPLEFRGFPDRGKARRVIVFANRVAEQVAQTHPGRYLVISACQSTLDPPEEPACLPNVVPAICHWHQVQDPLHPISASRAVSPANAAFRKVLDGWDALAEKLIAREYWCAPGYDPLLKAGVAPILFEDIPYYYAHGFVACTSPGELDWGNLALTHYLAAQLMWNVKRDPQKLLEDYFTTYYGAASGPMRSYFTRIWEVAYRHHLPPQVRVELSERDLAYLGRCLSRAALLVADDELRAARVQLAADFFAVYCAWRRAQESDQQPEAADQFLSLLQRLQDRGSDAVDVQAWRARLREVNN